MSGDNDTNTTVAAKVPAWAAPPVDAWKLYFGKLTILLTYYIIAFIFGQFVNWVCLLNINKTKLTKSARYMMLVQCFLNTSYITINFPYKAIILYIQRMFLPWPIKIFCGWLHLFCMFGSLYVQAVVAITRVLYIVFPTQAKSMFSTRAKSMVPASVPIIVGLCYAFPSVDPCCYRFYKFPTYAMSYVGYSAHIQLKFSIAASGTAITVLTICYTWVFFHIRAASKRLQGDQRKDKKEIRLTILFGTTGGAWYIYLIMFYTIYWSGLFKAYSTLLLMNEILEAFLLIIDPIVYLGMSSELRRPLYKLIGKEGPTMTATTRAGGTTKTEGVSRTAWTAPADEAGGKEKEKEMVPVS